MMTGPFSGSASMYSSHLFDFVRRHNLIVSNSSMDHPPSRPGFNANTTPSDLDWSFISAAFPSALEQVQYCDMSALMLSEEMRTDHMCVTVKLCTQSFRYERPSFMRVSRTWQPLEQGMIASVRALVCEADPCVMETTHFAHLVRREAEHDYRQQRKQQLMRNDEIVSHLLSGCTRAK